MKPSFFAFLLLALVPFGAGATSMTLFSEDFDAETPTLNYTSFAQFTVTSGSVDVVANGTYGVQCSGGAGNCVDMDGTTYSAGVLTSDPIAFVIGQTYTLSFDVSGSQGYPSIETLAYGITDGVSAILHLVAQPYTGFQTIVYSFVAAAASGSITFAGSGGDNTGALLDNVLLTTDMTAPVPLPGPLPLLAAALGGLALVRRRA